MAVLEIRASRSSSVAQSGTHIQLGTESLSMTQDRATDCWFDGVDPDDLTATRSTIENETADSPDAWPATAIANGFADTRHEYYDRLHEATLSATREMAQDAEQADDQQMIHCVRALDDCERTANEIAERVSEWAGSLFDDVNGGIDGARTVAERVPDGPLESRVTELAASVGSLDDEREALRAHIETHLPAVAPNLAAMAGPLLAARLIALAGGLESLAQKPSGTVQVLGAEDALFAHLSGNAPSPKHGAIFTHEIVRGTRPEDRGSAARAFAGKLAIAARIDHYRGTYDPAVHEELRDRVETIRAREEDTDE